MEEPYWKDDDAIATAAYHGDMKSIKTLIQIGKDINAQDEYRESATRTTGRKIDRDFGFDVNLAISG